MARRKDPTTFKIVPTSCRCGGSLAWVAIERSGVEVMIGCICHYTPHSLINIPLRRTQPKTSPVETRNTRRKPMAQSATSQPTNQANPTNPKPQ